MNWNSGSIVEAVTLSKSKNAYFVVYIEGTDDWSKKMTDVLNEPGVSSRLGDANKFVAIKIQSTSEAYKQFSQIYKLVPVPSLFIIGENGVPVEIVVGERDDLSSYLITNLDKVIALKEGSAVKPSSSTPASSSFIPTKDKNESKRDEPPKVSPEPEKKVEDGYKIVCEGGVCRKVKIEPEAEQASSSSTQSEIIKSDEPQPSIEEKVERAKELIEKKRLQKLEEEKEAERKRELERRSQGKGMAELKRWQQEQDMKNLKEERLREKKENELARQKILQQIAQDRADKLARESKSSPDPKPSESVPSPRPSVNSNVTRIQFKLPDGGSHNTQFHPNDSLANLRDYVRQNIFTSGGFSISTMYPRELLGNDRNSVTLRDLGLCPSSALLLIRDAQQPRVRGSSAPVPTNGGFLGMLTQIFWSVIVQPVQGVWLWLSNLVTGNANNNNNDSTPSTSTGSTASREEKRFAPNTSDSNDAKRRRVASGGGGTTSIRREGNTYRLKDNDSDDENNTWNGNSTQQM